MLAPMPRRLAIAPLLVLLLGACKPANERGRVAKITSAAAPTASAPAISSAPSAAPSGSAIAPIAPPATTTPPLAAGEVCRVTRGPVQLSITGQVTLWMDDPAGEGEPRFLFNQGGVARAVKLPPEPIGPKKNGKAAPSASARAPERLALSEPADRAVAPACAVAGAAIFCMDTAGRIHRASAPGQEGPVVAEGRAGTPLAAAPIAGARVVYAFLADRRTSEGATTLAFVGLDDQTPMTLSEDGAGATFVTLAARGAEVVAMYIDARRVLTPVHARVLTAGPRLALGTDAVLFVGSGTDGRVGGAIAAGVPGSEHALLAIDKDDKAFGMAAIRIARQPKDDAEVAWSLYPAAVDRAAIAATQGGYPARVLRTVPAAVDAGSKKILELGELDASGGYRPSCVVAEGPMFTDLAIAVDRRGALWLAYTDADGTWVERRGK